MAGITATKDKNNEGNFIVSIPQFIADKNGVLVELKPRTESTSVDKINVSLALMQVQIVALTARINEANAKSAACQAAQAADAQAQNAGIISS